MARSSCFTHKEIDQGVGPTPIQSSRCPRNRVGSTAKSHRDQLLTCRVLLQITCPMPISARSAP
jgi:hypothetical protein